MITEETVIIGAGPAGLAVGACLRRAGAPFLILEKADRVGASWHNHYDRLHLHTAKAFSALPHYKFPAAYPRYPSRMQVIEYLDAYAARFDLAPRLNQEVLFVRAVDSGWLIATHNAEYHSQNVVVATGFARIPNRPAWPGMAGYKGEVLHSSEYRNGHSYRGKNVLVVGCGNSGAEIALDLAEHGALPTISMRSPVNIIPRDLLGIPIVGLAIVLDNLPPRLVDAVMAPLLRLMYGNMERIGLPRPPYGPALQTARDRRIPVIDIGTVARIKAGDIAIADAVESFRGGTVMFEDGSAGHYDALICATGYRPQLTDFFANDHLAPDPGLYFCGFEIAPTGILREIAKEARAIGTAIAG